VHLRVVKLRGKNLQCPKHAIFVRLVSIGEIRISIALELAHASIESMLDQQH
jgi:hypothetical protein